MGIITLAHAVQGHQLRLCDLAVLVEVAANLSSHAGGLHSPMRILFSNLVLHSMLSYSLQWEDVVEEIPPSWTSVWQ